mgnify:CR=1 FL=1
MKLILENWREYKKTILKESGFSRIRQIMLGQVPSIDQIGILTAENPDGEIVGVEQNEEAMKQLKQSLQGIGYTNIGGSFGGPEKSVFINNISRDDVCSLGIEFGQESVIWGQKLRTEDGDPFFQFEYIEGYNTIETRDVSLGGEKVQDRTDYYSEKRGRKFIIPFFDSKHATARPVDGGRRISFEPAEIPDDDEAQELAESIKKRNRLLFDKNRTEKSRHHHRHILKLEINKLKNLLESRSNK